MAAERKGNPMKIYLALLIPLALVASALGYVAALLEHVERALQVGG